MSKTAVRLSWYRGNFSGKEMARDIGIAVRDSNSCMHQNLARRSDFATNEALGERTLTAR